MKDYSYDALMYLRNTYLKKDSFIDISPFLEKSKDKNFKEVFDNLKKRDWVEYSDDGEKARISAGGFVELKKYQAALGTKWIKIVAAIVAVPTLAFNTIETLKAFGCWDCVLSWLKVVF